MTLIFNGKFDLIHVGHINLMTYCRHLATYHGYVIAAIDSDRRIEEKNPMRPILNQDIRRQNLQALRVNNVPLIDSIHIFDTDDELLELIKSVTPDFIVKGSEWKGKPIIGSEVCPVKFYQMDGELHSTDIIELVLQKYGQK